MDIYEAGKMIRETFENRFDQARFRRFIKNFLNGLDETKAFTCDGVCIPDAFKEYIRKYKRIGVFRDENGRELDVLAVLLGRETTPDRSRTTRCNFVAWYLKNRSQKDAALVAFYADDLEEWRFSFIRVEYKLKQAGTGEAKVREEMTARCLSFLAGRNEPSHAVRHQLLPVIQRDKAKPSIENIELAFSSERMTGEFLSEYMKLYQELVGELESILARNTGVGREFEKKEIDVADFAKKLLGRFVFVSFLRKILWPGTARNGSTTVMERVAGLRAYLRLLFDGEIIPVNSFLDEFPEHLFYEVLDASIVKKILKVFDQYNFTAREDEPLEKEVAINPEMLGRIFERLLDARDHKSKGAVYTPPEIVHYMCRESLINYLSVELEGVLSGEEIGKFIREGEFAVENDLNCTFRNAELLDSKLATVKICDPAAGPGAFLVGMLFEIARIRNMLSTYLAGKANRSYYAFKHHAIEESLHGVDIEQGAVEINRLRLMLSLVVDSDGAHRIDPLPALGRKIRQGDSLCSCTIWKLHFAGVFNGKGGFDIVIANPPYVSNKTVDKDAQDRHKEVYGISDDLYNYFFQKAFEIVRGKGTVSFISSDTYLTINSKINLRKLFQANRIIEIIKLGNVFHNAMVETAIIILQKESCTGQDYKFSFKDARGSFEEPGLLRVGVNLFRNASGRAFFLPDALNMRIYAKYNGAIRELHETWWDMISSSRKIARNREVLEEYRKSLRPGEMTLLGIITDGGQGLATADNGKFIGLIKGTKAAARTVETRPIKLFEAVRENRVTSLNQISSAVNARKRLESMSEEDIRFLFDGLKERHGRDIFGQGYLYRIVDPGEVAPVEDLSEDEKLNGIDRLKPHFVPYDKGDKDGNRWYLETPFYIDWSREKIQWLKTNSGKKGQGMPVMRNPQFYFREGFCWSNVLNPNATMIKCRIKAISVNDVASMSLYPNCSIITAKYLVCLINSFFHFNYLRSFINNTVNIQINDLRQLPVIVPTRRQLNKFEGLFERAFKIKKMQFSGHLSGEEATGFLEKIQVELDQMVCRLYDISM